jgi:hypothetical protein
MALVQEEVGISLPVRAPYKADWATSGKSIPKMAWPLPPSPSRIEKQQAVPVTMKTPGAASLDTKLSAVKAYRRAMVLCYRCGEKWSKDHNCSPQVQLHLVQELWDLLPDDADSATPTETTSEDQQVFLAISLSAVIGTPAPRTVRFSGSVQGNSLTILLDSRSSSSFLNASVAACLQNVAAQANPCTVCIASGGTLDSPSTLLSVPWSIGQYAFTSDLRVLPLAAFDMIVGMDLLESFSPMHVHWKHKWLSIPYEGRSVVLQRELADSPVDLLLQVYTVDHPPPDSVPDSLPVEVQTLLEQFSDLFQ